MDKALAYGARDSRFDPWQDRLEMHNFLFENVFQIYCVFSDCLPSINTEKAGLSFTQCVYGL
jgi:hypothetical protein